MWDVQVKDGQCKVGKGQRPNPLNQDDDNDDDFNDRDDIASNVYFGCAEI
jgi:hypothetical protein